MERIRIAQIGIGHDHADDIFFAIRDMKDRFEVVGYALPECEKEKFAKRAAETFVGFPELTVEQIMNDPTIAAVTVETEELNLSNYALMAAQHGKHIHMDKPGGIEPKVFEELVETARKNGCVFHLGYMYRYNPCVQEVMRMVREGELGEVFSVEADMSCHHKPHKRKWLGRFPGGMMFFLGCHMVDLIVGIQGVPERVVALNKATGIDGINSEDHGMAVLEYKNGTSFAKSSAAEPGGFIRRGLVVNGSKGTVRLMPLEMVFDESDRLSLYTDMTIYRGTGWFEKGETTRSAPYDRYNAMITDFADAASGVKDSIYTYDYELAVYRTLMQCCGVEM